MLKIRVRVSFPEKGVKKNHGTIFLFTNSFCKPNKKLFVKMPGIDMVKNKKPKL